MHGVLREAAIFPELVIFFQKLARRIPRHQRYKQGLVLVVRLVDNSELCHNFWVPKTQLLCLQSLHTTPIVKIPVGLCFNLKAAPYCRKSQSCYVSESHNRAQSVACRLNAQYILNEIHVACQTLLVCVILALVFVIFIHKIVLYKSVSNHFEQTNT